MAEFIYKNGKRVYHDLPLRTLFFGEGVFETFRYKSSLPVHFKKHLQRLAQGARYLSMKVPQDSYITALLNKAISKSSLSDIYVKLCLLSEGGSAFFEKSQGTQVLIQLKDYAGSKDSITAEVSDYRKSSSSPILRIKSFNYLENILARRDAITNGYDEAIFLNEKANLTEGSAGNIFWFKEGTIYTPSVECGLLPGTTREILIELESKIDIKIEEGAYSLKQLLDAEFAFFTNSLMGSVPISQVGDKFFPLYTETYNKIERELYTELGWI